MMPGDNVFTVGNPESLNGTFSQGIVSGRRQINKIWHIQITAPISHGSSGGPVLNDRGEVIGIAVSSLEDGQNLNFAVPSSSLKSLVNRSIDSPDNHQRELSASVARWYLETKGKPSQSSSQHVNNAAQTGSLRFSVELDVSSRDDTVETQIISYIARELRALRDVDIVVSNSPDYRIQILAVESLNVAGSIIGYDLSIIITEPLDKQLISFISASQKTDEHKEIVRLVLDGQQNILAHWIKVGGPDDLRELCNRIVADLDAKHLEPVRKARSKRD